MKDSEIPTVDVIAARAWTTQGHPSYEVIVRTSQGTTLRARVLPDPSYDWQGSAFCEMWTPSGWSEVVRWFGAFLGTKFERVPGMGGSTRVSPTQLPPIANDLIREAIDITRGTQA